MKLFLPFYDFLTDEIISVMIERIKKIISYTGLSDRAFAHACGINQPTLFNQLKGLRAISLDTVRAIAATYPEVSGDWLLTGNGEMFKDCNRDVERLNSLVDTIATLQQALNEKSKTIELLQERINQLENHSNK